MRDAIKKPPTSSRAYEIMRMMWCVGRQSNVSQLTFCSMILSGYKPFFKQGPRPRCSYEIMRVKECVVEHRTVQRVNQLFYISMLLWFCLFYDTARCCIVIVRFFFETMDRLIRRLSSCFAYDLNRYDVMRTQPQECTRRTHAVSCGWSLMCMIWCAMSHTFEHSGHQQVNCCMHHVLTNIGRPLLPCCWGYSLGLFFLFTQVFP